MAVGLRVNICCSCNDICERVFMRKYEQEMIDESLGEIKKPEKKEKTIE